MKTLTFTPAAIADLESIYDYSAENWGVGRAESYIRALQDTCNALADGRKRGRDAGDIREGYFKQSCASHLIFFKQSDDALTVIRILHQSQDFERHL